MDLERQGRSPGGTRCAGLIVEDQFSFILHSEIMWQGSDADFAAPMVEITRAVVALNVHRLGRLLRDNAPREKTRKRHRHAA